MSQVVARLTREEYTGENRCWPCTALNLAVLAVGSLLLSLASPILGVASAVVGCAFVWTRGYLIPYTPRIGPRVAARLPGDPFHTDRRADGDTDSLADTSEVDAEAVLGSLVDAGVVGVEGEDLSLVSAFAERWDEEMRTLRALPLDELAAATLDAAPAASAVDTVESRGREYVILSDGSGTPGAQSWLRRPVAVGETAAARLLSEWDLDPGRRAVAAHALTLFLTECPACGAALSERPAGDCCGPTRTGPSGDPLEALVCVDCGVRLHVFE